MAKTSIIIILMVCLVLASCGIFNGGNNMARRYRNIQSASLFRNASDPQSFVQAEVNSYTVKQAPEAAVIYNLLSLSSEGQKALIYSLNWQAKDIKELREQLNTNFAFLKDKTANVKIIPKNIKKSLLFTIHRPYYDEAKNAVIFNAIPDRIAFLELSLNLCDKTNAAFDSWDRFVTDLLTLNLGKVSSAQEWNASLNLNAKSSGEITLGGSNATEDFQSGKNGNTTVIGNTSETEEKSNANSSENLRTYKGNQSNSTGMTATGEFGASGSVSFSDKVETSVDLTSRILKLSGKLSEEKIVLRQESGAGIDLSGNVAVSIDYTLKDDWADPVQIAKFKALYDSGIPIEVKNLVYQPMTLIFPDIKKDVTGMMDFSFLYRQVRGGSRHIPEARQKVRFWYGSVKSAENKIQAKAIVLIRKDDVRPKVYRIKIGADLLSVNGFSLNFESTSDAAAFLRYVGDIIQRSGTVTGLKIGAGDFNGANYGQLKIVTETL